MILFIDDWKKYPTAIIDSKTKNKSYLDLAALYRSMGIKNYYFLLALVNPELQGINPFDPQIDVETMAKIAIECKVNPWYYFREVSRVPGRGSPEATYLLANRGNIALFWLFFNHIFTILIQIRQTGKSISVDSLFNFLMNIYQSNTTIALLTKDDNLRSFNLERLKGIQSELPFYLNQKSKNDISNTEMMSVKNLKNEFRALVPNKSIKMALNIGRGLTVPTMSFDEAAFTPNIAITMPAALAAGTTVRAMARDNGDPYGTLVTTTVGKKDDVDGKFIYQLMSNSAVWSEKFFDCKDLDELEKVIRSNSPKKSLRVNCTFNHRQLGYTDEWLKRAIEEAVGTGEEMQRDFFNVWSSGTQASPLSANTLDRIRKSEKEPLYTEISQPNAYITRWYITEDQIISSNKQSHWILALDSSDASGGDDIALVVKDIRTGATVAAGNYNETNLITFSEWLLSWIIRFDNLTMIIERRSTGSSILDYLLLMLVSRNINPFKRLYNKAVQESDEFPDRFDLINKKTYMEMNELIITLKKTFGFATSATGATSRSDLYGSTLSHSAKYTGDIVYDKTIIDQVTGLVVRNGRVDHQEGEHDDSSVSWLLCHWFMTLGRRLEFYGIDSRSILSINENKSRDIENGSDYEATEQKRIKEDIDNIVEQIKKERDVFIVQKLEGRLRQLHGMYKNTDGSIVAYDDLIRELRDFKRMTKHTSSFNNNFAYNRSRWN